MRPLKKSLKELREAPDTAPFLLSNASGEVGSVVQLSAAAIPDTSTTAHPL